MQFRSAAAAQCERLASAACAIRGLLLTVRACKLQPVRMRACVVACAFLVGLPYLSEPTRRRDRWVLALRGIAFQASWPHDSRALSRNLPRQWLSYKVSRLTPVKSSTVFLKWVSKSLALASFPMVYAFTCAFKGAAVCWRCSRAPC